LKNGKTFIITSLTANPQLF